MDDTIQMQLNRALDEYIAQHYIGPIEDPLLDDLFEELFCASQESPRKAARAKKRFAFLPKIDLEDRRFSRAKDPTPHEEDSFGDLDCEELRSAVEERSAPATEPFGIDAFLHKLGAIYRLLVQS